jgi:hypothetical protein
MPVHSEASFDFWTHPEVEQFINAQMEAPGWKSDPGGAAWRALQGDIVKNNSAETFPRFRCGLFVWVDLLRILRTRLQKVYGRDCWQRAKKLLKDDPRARVAIRTLRQLSAADRLDAVDVLTRLGRGKKGIPYHLPAGTIKYIGGTDCGMDVWVEVSRQIEAALASERNEGSHMKNEVTRETASPAQTPGIVTIKALGGDAIKVRHGGRTCQLKNSNARMLLFFYAKRNQLSTYQELWDYLYPTLKYIPEQHGPPAALRRRKCDLNRLLKEGLGPPPRGTDWIKTEKGIGYQATRAVKWVLRREGREYMEEVVKNPWKLDGNQLADDE